MLKKVVITGIVGVGKITPYNHNTSIFRLKFPKPLKEPSPIASCVLLKDDSSQIMRPYTPISIVDELNHIDLMIKRYDNGHMSKLVHSLKVGDKIDVKGPIVTLPYKANMKKHIGMICGGTGITPMHQLIDCILRNPEDKTKIYLVYANIAKKIFFFMKKNWTQGTGFVSPENGKENIPAPSDDVLVLVCGPGGMMRHISGPKARDRSQGPVEGILKELGYTQNQVHKF
ncbi:unnamed protein product [Rhizophagus irregularis]|nr:unnamed protein product [Rhizophagus irregularis]